jgi:lipopolysaccharide assembly protein A
MSTEQPIPTSTPLPRPAIGDEAPPPTSEMRPEPAAPSAGAGQPAVVTEPPAEAGPSHAAAPSLKPRHTRTSGLWVAVGFFAVILLLLLIFILQNGKTVDVSYMGAHGHLPLGVALLLAAVCGVLLVVLAGAARISQLRTVARRHRRAHAQRANAADKPAS